jgi:hypothetical protein
MVTLTWSVPTMSSMAATVAALALVCAGTVAPWNVEGSPALLITVS